jgi:hypothetical protein
LFDSIYGDNVSHFFDIWIYNIPLKHGVSAGYGSKF